MTAANYAIPPERDPNRAHDLTKEVEEVLEDQYTYHPWTDDQREDGEEVRRVLLNAAKTIVAVVPAGPDRSVALRKLREARMDANSAITHGGKY